MTEVPDVLDRELVYMALIFAIRANWGVGFHNADQGHPFYSPRGTLESRSKEWDGPDSNQLFMMLRELSLTYGREGSTTTPKIDTWQDFCELAHSAHLKDFERERKGLPRMSELD